MSDYTGYVLGVYGVSAVVYGGLVLLWWRRLRQFQQRLQAEGWQAS